MVLNFNSVLLDKSNWNLHKFPNGGVAITIPMKDFHKIIAYRKSEKSGAQYSWVHKLYRV